MLAYRQATSAGRHLRSAVMQAGCVDEKCDSRAVMETRTGVGRLLTRGDAPACIATSRPAESCRCSLARPEQLSLHLGRRDFTSTRDILASIVAS